MDGVRDPGPGAVGEPTRAAGGRTSGVLRAVLVVALVAGAALTLSARGTGAAVLVSVTAAQQVVPSVRLVLVGLAAAVAAMVVATRAHRN